MQVGSYGEGDWFAVPLREGGFAVGVIARAMPHKEGILLGYFFGPRRDDVPTLDELKSLSASDAVLVDRFGHLGLVRGTWPLLGRIDGWDRGAWPTPAFGRFEELTGRPSRSSTTTPTRTGSSVSSRSPPTRSSACLRMAFRALEPWRGY
jgi:hypothetical protein